MKQNCSVQQYNLIYTKFFFLFFKHLQKNKQNSVFLEGKGNKRVDKSMQNKPPWAYRMGF